MTSELRDRTPRTRSYVKDITTQRAGNFAHDHDLRQLAAATDNELLTCSSEVRGEAFPTLRLLARTKEDGIVRHQGKQADQIAGIDGIDPDRMQTTDLSLVRIHPPPPQVAFSPADEIEQPSAATK